MNDRPSRLRTLMGPVGGYFRDLWAGIKKGWDRFWFTPADPAMIGMIRILTAGLFLYVHLSTTHKLLDYIGDDAYMDETAINQLAKYSGGDFARDADGNLITLADGSYKVEAGNNEWFGVWSIYFLLPSNPEVIWTVHIAFMICAFLYLIGFCSRTMSVLVWVYHISYILRAWMNWYGMDSIISFLMIYLMFAPTGAAFSVDALLARYRASRQGLRTRGGKLPGHEPQKSVAANIATRMIQIHLCIVYFCSGMAKLKGTTWWSGDAVYLTLMTHEFALTDMAWMCKVNLGHPDFFWHFLSVTGVVLTLFFEICFVFLVWKPRWRPIMIVLGLLMHAKIGIFMGLGSFQFAMVVALMAFIRPDQLRWVWRVLFEGRHGYHYMYDAKDQRQTRAAAWIHAGDPYEQIKLVPSTDRAASAPAGSLVTPDGKALSGYDALKEVVRTCRSLWIVGWLTLIPGVGLLGRALYPQSKDKPKTPKPEQVREPVGV